MTHVDVQAILAERRREFAAYLSSELCFGKAWTDAATHEQRLHRLDHLRTGFPWTYADGPEGFDEDHPFGPMS